MNSLIQPLLRYAPIPLVLAQLARSGVMAEIPANLVARIRTEHPRDFDAQLQSVIVEFEVLKEPEKALGTLKRINDQFSIRDDDKRDRFCGLMFEVAARLGGESIIEANTIVKDLLGNENEFELYFNVLKEFDGKAYDEALEILLKDDRVEDALWWQMVAKCHEQLDHKDDAANAMAKACDLMPHPSLLNAFAYLSLAKKDWSPAIGALEKALTKSPDDVQTISRLAMLNVDVRNHLKAADQFKKLVELEPEIQEHKLNLAISLARAAQLDEANSILDSISESGSPDLQILLTRAQILRSADQSHAAYGLLQKNKGQFWNDANFVAMLMDLAYRTNNGSVASDAMQQLLKLQDSFPEDGRKFLQPHSLEDFIEHAEQRRKHMDELGVMVANGKMPWLYADAMFGIPAFKSWHYRSMKFDWVSEQRSVRGQSTVYSTNSFGVLKKDDGSAEIERLTHPVGEVEIVADFSALVTLFQIGRLQDAIDYFGKLLIPGTLAELRLEELMSHHQPEQEESLKRIRQSIDTKTIKVLENDSFIQLLDAFDKDNKSFRMDDLADALDRSGHFSTENIDEIRDSVPDGIAGQSTNKLDLGEALVVDLTTLTTLSKTKCFSRLLERAKLAINKDDYHRMLRELSEHEQINRVNVENNQFWKLIESSEKVTSIGVEPTGKQKGEFRTIPHLDASLIAVEQNLHLLADDRVSQQLRLSESSESNTAFGSDQVILALWRAGSVTIHEAADDYLKLIRWRYRFLIPPPAFLKELADRSRSNLPGPDLFDVARYMHDCMQDPGLLCGFEKTSPPMPVAFKFNFGWMTNSIEFVRLLAEDESYGKEELEVLVQWIVKSLVPSTPNYLLHQPVGKNITSAIANTVLKLSLSSLVAIRPLERASLIARIVANALPLNETDFYRIAAEAANERSI